MKKKECKKSYTQGSYLFMPACFHHLSLLRSSVPPSTNPRERWQGWGAWTEESTHHMFAHWDTPAKSSIIWKQCNLPMLFGCISWHRAFNRLHCFLMSHQSSTFAQIMWCSARTNAILFLCELMQHPLRCCGGSCMAADVLSPPEQTPLSFIFLLLDLKWRVLFLIM